MPKRDDGSTGVASTGAVPVSVATSVATTMSLQLLLGEPTGSLVSKLVTVTGGGERVCLAGGRVASVRGDPMFMF